LVKEEEPEMDLDQDLDAQADTGAAPMPGEDMGAAPMPQAEPAPVDIGNGRNPERATVDKMAARAARF
jgi:hypothetical protein